MPDKLSDSIIDGQQRARRFREESAKREAEQAEQERHQRDRQARHREQAMLIDAEMQELIGRRILRAQEEAKLQPQPQVKEPPVSLYTERQETELSLEQAAGKRALAKYAKKNTI